MEFSLVIEYCQKRNGSWKKEFASKKGRKYFRGYFDPVLFCGAWCVYAVLRICLGMPIIFVSNLSSTLFCCFNAECIVVRVISEW